MQDLSEMHEKCSQCGFEYARIDTERWLDNTARRVMCPVCGWTRLEEHHWPDGVPQLLKRTESFGFGAYRLVPPGGYSGYNAFHSSPDPAVIEHIRELLNKMGMEGVPDALGSIRRSCPTGGGESSAKIRCIRIELETTVVAVRNDKNRA